MSDTELASKLKKFAKQEPASESEIENDMNSEESENQ